MAMLGRPSFTATDRESAETFFLTSLEQWRQKMGLEKMILMGHSMGGYLSATYALQHPERIQHLILVGPAGIVSTETSCMAPRCSLRVHLYFTLVGTDWCC